MKEMAKATWEYFFSGNERTPGVPVPRRRVKPERFSGTPGRGLDATWLGHSSLIINIDGFRILTDPVFERSVSIVGPSRYSGDLPLDPGEIERVDAVIISHNHYDHLNRASVKLLEERTARFIVPLGVGTLMKKWGISGEKIVELDWWESCAIGEGLDITATPAQHFSGRGPFDGDKTLWASWVVAGPEHRIFFSGDSGYFDGFKAIGEKYGPFHISFLECGAYNRAWSKVHMFPEETVLAHGDLRGEVLHPIHWGTFNLAPHAWYEPMERVTAAASAVGVTLATPPVGGTTVYGGAGEPTRWWEAAMAAPVQREVASSTP